MTCPHWLRYWACMYVTHTAKCPKMILSFTPHVINNNHDIDIIPIVCKTPMYCLHFVLISKPCYIKYLCRSQIKSELLSETPCIIMGIVGYHGWIIIWFQYKLIYAWKTIKMHIWNIILCIWFWVDHEFTHARPWSGIGTDPMADLVGQWKGPVGDQHHMSGTGT